MSRGGRGGGRGSRRAPDPSYDDSEQTPSSNTPAPTFPRLDLATPKPLESAETASVDSYLSFRRKIHNGPLFSVLDPSSITDEKGKVDKRAGFDPFNDQEVYTSQSQKKKKQNVPDLNGRAFALHFFPKELWPILDPKRKHPLWNTVEGALAGSRSRKRKRPTSATAEQSQTQNEGEQNSDEDSDVVIIGRRKHNAAKSRRSDLTSKSAKQKEGLDAEDDFPDADPNDEDDGDIDDALQDSEFDDSNDDADDYNAEQYFDGGDDDDFGFDDVGGDEEAWM